MSRRKTGMVAEDDEPELNMSSLIDVTFLLLIYFLVTSTIQPQEKDLPMTLPSQTQSDTPPLDVEPMLIAVKNTGAGFSIVVNKTEQLDTEVVGRDRELPMLSENLKSYGELALSGGQQPIVQLYLDPELPQQTAIDVLNSLRGAQINSVTFTENAE